MSHKPSAPTSGRWVVRRRGQMVEYIVKEYVLNADGTREVKVSILTDRTGSSDGLWYVLQEAKETGRKVLVYRVGECLLDWS
jgi:hypothetical protein